MSGTVLVLFIGEYAKIPDNSNAELMGCWRAVEHIN